MGTRARQRKKLGPRRKHLTTSPSFQHPSKILIKPINLTRRMLLRQRPCHHRCLLLKKKGNESVGEKAEQAKPVVKADAQKESESKISFDDANIPPLTASKHVITLDNDQ